MRLHYRIYFPHSTERKNVAVTEILLASKEEQQQSLHYDNEFPQEWYAVKPPAIINEKNPQKQKKYVISVSFMVRQFKASLRLSSMTMSSKFREGAYKARGSSSEPWWVSFVHSSPQYHMRW